MAELGIERQQVQAEVETIIKLANQVKQDAANLSSVAKQISAKGIQNVGWYDGTFSQIIAKLENNKVADAVDIIRAQANKLVGISEQSAAFSADKR